MPLKKLRPLLLPLAVGAVSLSVTGWLWLHERQTVQHALWANFDTGLRQTVARIEQRMAAYEQMLRGAQGLFQASEHLRREDFAVYVDALLAGADAAGLQMFAYAPMLPAERIDAHVAAQRAGGMRDYAVYPAGQRDVFGPLTYVAPASVLNQRAVGFDLHSEPVRRAALLRARDSGNIVMTGKVRLIMDSSLGPQSGFLMVLPLYARGQAVDTVERRRAHITGWILAAFRMTDLMSSLYGEGVPGIDVRIYDGVELNPAALLHDSGADHAPDGEARIGAQEYISIAGHTWTLSAGMRPEFGRRYLLDSASIIGIAGTGLSLLLMLLTWQLATGRARAHALAQAMTNELRESENHLRHMAQHDVLTGLPNRRLFREQLEHDILKSRRSGLPIGLLFIDLDHFKAINDTLGHAMGDVLLVEAARRIGACVRESDTVARLGGDEFIVTLTELHDPGRIDIIAQHIIDALAAPFVLGARQGCISASIGIALYPEHGEGIDALLKYADRAMYAAKEAGRNRFSRYTPDLQSAA